MTPDQALPEITEVRRLDVRPGDRIVVTVKHASLMSMHDAQTLKERVSAVLDVDPGRVLVMAGADLCVLSTDGDGT